MDVFEHKNGIYHHSLITDIVRTREIADIRQFPNVVLTQHMAFIRMWIRTAWRTAESEGSFRWPGVSHAPASCRQATKICR